VISDPYLYPYGSKPSSYVHPYVIFDPYVYPYLYPYLPSSYVHPYVIFDPYLLTLTSILTYLALTSTLT
jgi:hypothetical protein